MWTEPPGFSLGVAPERGHEGMSRLADGCPRSTSARIAADTASGRERAEAVMGREEDRAGPVQPMSAPYSSRWRTGRSRGCGTSGVGRRSNMGTAMGVEGGGERNNISIISAISKVFDK